MITVVYCTRQPNPEHTEHIIKTSGLHKSIEVIEIINNGESLTKAYNRGLSQAKSDIVVFCHDDIIFNKNNWGAKVEKHFNRDKDLAILGVAGTTFMSNTGRWWDIPATMMGIVKHQNDGKEWASKYSDHLGNQLSEVVLVDGLFFAIDKTRIKNSFNEEVEGFHFYDVEFCFSNFVAGAKICVTYEVDITHKSIGQTNESWEINREKFAEKWKDNLPVSVTKTELDVYVFVHDQSIIKVFEESGKFKQFTNYKYVFLGNRATDEVNTLENIIVARELPINIEEHPNFTAFSGWYALYKNNLLRKDVPVLLLEYDVHLTPNFQEHLTKHIVRKKPMVSFTPFPMTNYHFVNNPDWVHGINEAIKKVYRIDIVAAIKNQIQLAVNKGMTPIWPATNNIFMSYDNFIKYMKWCDPLVPHMKTDPNAGHAQERCLTFFSLMMHVNYEFIPNVLKHEQMDSHKTQGHNVNYEEAIKRLA